MTQRGLIIFLIGILIIILVSNIIFWKVYDFKKKIEAERILKIKQYQLAYTDVLDNPHIGNFTAKLPIVIYGAFDSKDTFDMFKKLLDIYNKNQDKIVIIWRDYPLTKTSLLLADIGRCGYEFGKFNEIAEVLFKKRELAFSNEFKEITFTKLERENLKMCILSKKFRKDIAKDVSSGIDIGIDLLPVVFIKDRMIKGVVSKDTILDTINNLLKL